MAVRLFIDRGAEYLLPFAKKKLRELDTLDIISRVICVTSGEQIYVQKGEVDVIRIRGATPLTSFGVLPGTAAQYNNPTTAVAAGYNVNLYSFESKTVGIFPIPYSALPPEWQSPGAIFTVSKDGKAAVVLRQPTFGAVAPYLSARRVENGVGAVINLTFADDYAGRILSNGFTTTNILGLLPRPSSLAGWNYSLSRFVFLSQRSLSPAAFVSSVILGFDVEDGAVHRRIDLTLPADLTGCALGGVSPNCKYAWVLARTTTTVPLTPGFSQTDRAYLIVVNLDSGAQISTKVAELVETFDLVTDIHTGSFASATVVNEIRDDGSMFTVLVQQDVAANGSTSGYRLQLVTTSAGTVAAEFNSTSAPLTQNVLTSPIPLIAPASFNQQHAEISDAGLVGGFAACVNDDGVTKSILRVVVRNGTAQAFTESVASSLNVVEQAIAHRTKDNVYFVSKRTIGGQPRIGALAFIAGVQQSAFFDVDHTVSIGLRPLALDYDSRDELHLWAVSTSFPGSYSRFAIRNLAPLTVPPSPAQWGVTASDADAPQVAVKTITVNSTDIPNDVGVPVPFALYPQTKPV